MSFRRDGVVWGRNDIHFKVVDLYNSEEKIENS